MSENEDGGVVSFAPGEVQLSDLHSGPVATRNTGIDTLEAAQRLVKVVCGEPHGDGNLVMDVGKGTERDPDQVWVTGNWNVEPYGSRLFDALERIDVEANWFDMHDKCADCGKLMETTPSWAGWQAGYLHVPDASELVCFDCLDTDTDDVLDEFRITDNPGTAVPDVLGRHLEGWGWAPFNGVFESGWHPGQTDDTRKVFRRIKGEYPNLSVVFRLDETSMFYIRWTAWTKDRSDKSDD